MFDKQSILNIQTGKYESFEGTSQTYVFGQRNALNHLMLNIPTTARILDVACGDGTGLRWFLENGYSDVFGCEINPRKIVLAETTGFPVIEADMHKIPLEDNFFDVVYSSHSLEHAYDPLQVLAEFKRLLKPEGRLLLIVPYPDTGPDDAHCGKYKLRTDLESFDKLGVSGITAVLSSCGFLVTHEERSDIREKEIWLVSSKEQTCLEKSLLK